MIQRQRNRFIKATRMISAVGGMVACLVSNVSSLAIAQQANIDAKGGPPAFAPGMIAHMQAMRRFKDPDRGAQQTPPVIPKFEMDNDPAGGIATFQPGGATFPANNAFFQNLGTNGRTCFTCHQPQNGWTVSAASVAARFADSKGTDPIFRLVDGATCPTADVSTLQAKRQAYALLIDKGLIRIGLPMPSGTQFEVTSVDDPYSCNTRPVTGLTSPTTGIVSVYRRPLPSTNIGFLSTIMFDGREPSLTSQARDATLGHAQASTAPTDAQLAQIVAFETGVYTAQEIDRTVGVLHGDGALGGPVALSLQPFFIGVNDPLGNNPKGLPFIGAWMIGWVMPSRSMRSVRGHISSSQSRLPTADPTLSSTRPDAYRRDEMSLMGLGRVKTRRRSMTIEEVIRRGTVWATNSQSHST
jgi:hypothetical protein